MGNLLDEEGRGMVVDRVPRNASGMSDLPSHLIVFYRLRWIYTKSMGCACWCARFAGLCCPVWPCKYQQHEGFVFDITTDRDTLLDCSSCYLRKLQ